MGRVLQSVYSFTSPLYLIAGASGFTSGPK